MNIHTSEASKVVSKKVFKKILKQISKNPEKAIVANGYTFEIVGSDLVAKKSGKLIWSGFMDNLKSLWTAFISFLKLIWAYVKSFFEKLANWIAGNGFQLVSANKAPKKLKKVSFKK